MSDDDRFFNTQEAAGFCHLSPKSLMQMRKDGRGPKFLRPAGTLKFLYRKSDLVAWLEGKPAETPEQRLYRFWPRSTGRARTEQEVGRSLTDAEYAELCAISSKEVQRD
jgi:hypothetical protein